MGGSCGARAARGGRQRQPRPRRRRTRPRALVVAGRGCLAHAARGGPPRAAPVAVGGGPPLAAPAPLVVMKRINSLNAEQARAEMSERAQARGGCSRRG